MVMTYALEKKRTRKEKKEKTYHCQRSTSIMYLPKQKRLLQKALPLFAHRYPQLQISHPSPRSRIPDSRLHSDAVFATVISN